MKSILLPIHDDSGQEARFRAALSLTRALDGDLTCLGEAPEAAHWQARLSGEGVAWRWSERAGEGGPDGIAAVAGLADLIIAGPRCRQGPANRRWERRGWPPPCSPPRGRRCWPSRRRRRGSSRMGARWSRGTDRRRPSPRCAPRRRCCGSPPACCWSRSTAPAPAPAPACRPAGRGGRRLSGPPWRAGGGAPREGA